MDVSIVYESLFGNTRHGYRLAAKPEGFIVTGTAGPLREGELDRARAWGAALAAQPTPAPVS